MSVNLITDNGKYTLSGSYCPTTVNLICNATNVPHLRWTYAYNASKNTIVLFQSDSSVIPNYANTAFPFYQLTEFSAFKNHKNQSLMNASTI